MTKFVLHIIIAVIACCFIPSGTYAMNEMASSIDADATRIVVSAQGVISIYGAKGQIAYIYNVLGVKVGAFEIDSNEKRIELSLSNGCYIIKVGKAARKVFVKR